MIKDDEVYTDDVVTDEDDQTSIQISIDEPSSSTPEEDNAAI
jgi:hypothetical protein